MTTILFIFKGNLESGVVLSFDMVILNIAKNVSLQQVDRLN